MVTDVNHIYGGDHFATYINIKKKDGSDCIPWTEGKISSSKH